MQSNSNLALKSEVLDRYADLVLSRVPSELVLTYRANVAQALNTVLYGGIVTNYLEKAIAEAEASPELIAAGINVLAINAVRSELGFAGDQQTCVENIAMIRESGGKVDDESEMAGCPLVDVLHFEPFLRAHAQLKERIARGEIGLMSWAFVFDIYTSAAQVIVADRLFGELPVEVQRLMSSWNYGSFNAKTMRTGAALLSDPNLGNLTAWTERGLQEGMPHLTLSNMGIGALLSKLMGTMEAEERLNIINMGAGTGATSAALAMGMEDAVQNRGFQPGAVPISLTDIEGSPSFFEVLRDFAPALTEKLGKSEIALPVSVHGEKNEEKISVEAEGYNLLYGDILTVLKSLEFQKVDENTITVVTANYVWHRLPTVVKRELISYIAEKFPNSMFMIADLVQNGSAVNRGYYNFRDNGLLNCGNIGLKELLEEQGYLVVPMDDYTGEASLGELGKRLGQGATSDSIFYVAVRGPKMLKKFDRTGNLRARYGTDTFDECDQQFEGLVLEMVLDVLKQGVPETSHIKGIPDIFDEAAHTAREGQIQALCNVVLEGWRRKVGKDRFRFSRDALLGIIDAHVEKMDGKLHP